MKKSEDDLAVVFAVWTGAGPGPAEDLEDRVVATIAAEPTTPPQIDRRWGLNLRLVALALAVPAAAALALLVGRRFAREDHGTATAAAHRETIAIGGRGKAVLEPEAQVSWSVTANNDAEVEQSAGRVFYRVEKGGSFTVRTPSGTAVALGTCFGVEVKMVGKPNPKQWMAGATGAALATAVLVTVYEGKVLVASGPGKTALVAGERATLRGPLAPMRDPDGESGAAASALRATGAPGVANSLATADAALSFAELAAKYEAQSRELGRLQEAVAAAHRPAGDAEDGRATYVDPTKEELVARAKHCSLAWDAPPVDVEAPKVDDRWGLTPGEKEIVGPILAKFNEQELRAMRDLYVEVTGAKDLAERLSPSALVSEIREKAPHQDVQQAFRQVSGELAGLVAPATGDQRSTPVERLTRLQVTAGDRFERAVAGELGSARAHEVRKKDGGWNSKFGENVGCPGGQPPPGL